MNGSIRWLKRAGTYGFVAPEDGGDDVFVRLDGTLPLAPGDPVNFAVIDGPRGPEAIDLQPGHAHED